MTLPTKATCHAESNTDGTGVVHRRDLHCGIRISLSFGLVSEHAKREEDNVDVAGIEDTVDDLRMRGRVGSLKVDRLDARDTCSRQRRDCRVTGR